MYNSLITCFFLSRAIPNQIKNRTNFSLLIYDIIFTCLLQAFLHLQFLIIFHDLSATCPDEIPKPRGLRVTFSRIKGGHRGFHEFFCLFCIGFFFRDDLEAINLSTSNSFAAASHVAFARQTYWRSRTCQMFYRRWQPPIVYFFFPREIESQSRVNRITRCQDFSSMLDVRIFRMFRNSRRTVVPLVSKVSNAWLF